MTVTTSGRGGAAATLAFLFAGPIVWGVRFLAVYSFTAIACENGWSPGLVRTFMIVTTVAAVVMLGLVIAAGLRSRGTEARTFLGRVAATVAGLAIVAIIFETVPGFTVEICA